MSLLTASTALAKEIKKECLKKVRMARLKTMPTICPIQGSDKIRQRSTQKKNKALNDGYKEHMLKAQWEICADPENGKQKGSHW